MKTSKKFTFRRGETLENHSGLTKDQVMIRTFIAMCIPAIAAIIAMGRPALFNILTAVVVSLLTHFLIKAYEIKSFRVFGVKQNCTYKSPYSPLVAGMIVGLCVGELTPYGLTAFIAFLTMFIFKWGQEKVYQRKLVNPAAAAKAVVLLIISLMWFLNDPLRTGLLFYPEHLEYALYTREGFLAAMELAQDVGFYGTERLNTFWSLLLWKRHGWIGGASGIAVIASGVLLASWIKLKWRITVVYLAGVTLISILLGIFTGGDIALRIAYHVFTGSVIFLAFYMATDPKTTPVTWKGQYLFGFLLAILTMFFQLVGIFGSSFVALAMLNPYDFHLDRLAMRLPIPSSFFAVKSLKSKDALKKYLRFPNPSYSSGETALEEIEENLEFDGEVSDCIRCGFCLEVCPKDLHPILAINAHHHDDEKMKEHVYPEECINCDLCTYVCPALIKVPEHLDEIRRKMHLE